MVLIELSLCLGTYFLVLSKLAGEKKVMLCVKYFSCTERGMSLSLISFRSACAQKGIICFFKLREKIAQIVWNKFSDQLQAIILYEQRICINMDSVLHRSYSSI